MPKNIFKYAVLYYDNESLLYYNLKHLTMEMYELLLDRVVTLTNEYLKIKEELKELKGQTIQKKHNDDCKIIHMRIDKKK